MRVYLDNAATTRLDEEVFEAMKPYLLNEWGNPSSIHSHGRNARSAIEKARRTVAELLQTSPAEIFFTSGGTEADNTAIRCTVESKNIQHIISSPIEHHAVLHTIQHLENAGRVQVHLLNIDQEGNPDLEQLEHLLNTHSNCLVSLMHANNEIGNLLDLYKVGGLCAEHKAVFHSDTVQAVGHYQHNLSTLPIQHIVGSAHKFHGPKGIGFLYINNEHKICPFLHGGSQERNMRGGTENVYGIVGLAKALELAYQNMAEHKMHIQAIKSHAIKSLTTFIPGVRFNGSATSPENNLYTVLNVSLPPTDDNEMLLFSLDINGISASGGSACSSGTQVGSHVLQALNADPKRGSVRFSFSRFTTIDEINYTVKKLADLYQVKA